MTRKQAKAAGRSHYHGGLPCPYGHTAGRRTSDRKCLACDALRQRKRYQDDKAMPWPPYAVECIMENCGHGSAANRVGYCICRYAYCSGPGTLAGTDDL